MMRKIDLRVFGGQKTRWSNFIVLAIFFALAAAGAFLWYGHWHRAMVTPAPRRRKIVAKKVLFTEPPPLLYEPLTSAEAQKANKALPFVTTPNPPAAPFVLTLDDPIVYRLALDCMTAAIYYEAGSESAEGRAAVAQIILNRVRHPLYPKSICGVVFQGSERATGCQFSFTCDGALARMPNPVLVLQARRIAAAALAGHVVAKVGWSTHYHTQWVLPYWAPTLAKTANIGAHIFYRLFAPLGRIGNFNSKYPGREPSIQLMVGFAVEPPLEHLLDFGKIETAQRTPNSAEEPLAQSPPTINNSRSIAATGPLATAAQGEPTGSIPRVAEPMDVPNYFPRSEKRTRGRLPM